MKQGGLLQDIAAVLDSVCGPWLNLFRRFIPPMGGIDFSPVVAIMRCSWCRGWFCSFL